MPSSHVYSLAFFAAMTAMGCTPADSEPLNDAGDSNPLSEAGARDGTSRDAPLGRGCSDGCAWSAGSMSGCTDASDCYGGECVELVSGRMACTRPPSVEEHDLCYEYPGVSDECGCPGRACPQGLTCRTREVELGAGAGAPTFVNECGRDECRSNEDCASTEVCQQVWLSVTPYEAFSRCVPSACVNDAECDGCGQCTPRFRFGDQGATVYEGLACCSAPYTGITPAPTHEDAAPPDANDAGCEDTPFGQDGGLTPSDACISCLAGRCPQSLEACGSTCFEMVQCAYQCMTTECIDACKNASPCTWPTAEAILYCMEPCDCPVLTSLVP